MPFFLHQPIADAPFEPYGGPPGRLDVADIVTTANSTSIAAGLCIAEGGPLVYRVDYDAVVIALDDDLVWEDARGPQALRRGDAVWIAEGAKNAYWSTGTSHFFYTTWPVNWAEIVGWQAGRDVKDLANQGGPEGTLEGIMVRRRADAASIPLRGTAGTAQLTPLLGAGDRVSMGAGLITIDGALDLTAPCDLALVVLEGTPALAVDGRRIAPDHGDLLWLSQGTRAAIAAGETATLGCVAAAPDWADRLV